jgi:Flp pilus assembly protein TadB
LLQSGDAVLVIGVGIAFILLGVVFLFVIPWVGIPVGILGLLLAIAWIAGFGRRAAGRDEGAESNRI